MSVTNYQHVSELKNSTEDRPNGLYQPKPGYRSTCDMWVVVVIKATISNITQHASVGEFASVCFRSTSPNPNLKA